MRKLQPQGPFVFEQPNLDNASESHLYFGPGDGRLNIAEEHLADAIETLVGRSRASFSADRTPKNPYQ